MALGNQTLSIPVLLPPINPAGTFPQSVCKYPLPRPAASLPSQNFYLLLLPLLHEKINPENILLIESCPPVH